jgi:hypothetical protein
MAIAATATNAIAKPVTVGTNLLLLIVVSLVFRP